MKSTLLKIFLPMLAATGILSAAQTKEESHVAPQYNHRMVVFHPGHQGYEFMPNDDLYLGIDLYGTQAYHTEDRTGKTLLAAEARLGRSMFYNGCDHIRPIVGGGVFRDMDEVDFVDVDQNGIYVIKTDKNPMIAYGLIGCIAEREFNDRLALGVTVKGLFGGIVGKKYGATDTFRYGADISVPLTVRLGTDRHWDLRLEPFALLLNDGNRYIGHRSAIAYRF